MSNTLAVGFEPTTPPFMRATYPLVDTRYASAILRPARGAVNTTVLVALDDKYWHTYQAMREASQRVYV